MTLGLLVLNRDDKKRSSTEGTRRPQGGAKVLRGRVAGEKSIRSQGNHERSQENMLKTFRGQVEYAKAAEIGAMVSDFFEKEGPNAGAGNVKVFRLMYSSLSGAVVERDIQGER